MIGRVHSIQSLGTVDGPGVRFVVFFQGCPLRCSCCHNPDTWEINGGKEMTDEEIVSKAKRFKEYFGKEGGITLSGGEPLLQWEFARSIFEACKEQGINTCLDTSGALFNQGVKTLIDLTDRVLLDIKYTNNEDYLKYVGCSMDKPLEFLSYLDSRKVPVTLRQVVVPTVNDEKENFVKLKDLFKKYSCVDKIELLPFRKICQTKYDSLNLHFPFEHISEPTAESMMAFNDLVSN